MHFLGGVDRLKPDRERAYQIACRRGRATGGARAQIGVGRRFVLAPIDGGEAVALDEFEKDVPALLAQHFADRVAEGMHILAQGGILEREIAGSDDS